jgi:hypothetical protein
MNIIKLTTKEMEYLAKKIGKPVFKFILKRIEKEVGIDGLNKIDINDLVNLIIFTMANLDNNVLMFTGELFKRRTGTMIDFSRMLSAHMHNLTSIIDENNNKKGMN